MDFAGLVSIRLQFADGSVKEFQAVGGGQPGPQGPGEGEHGPGLSRGVIEQAIAAVLVADGLMVDVVTGVGPDGHAFSCASPEVVDPFIDLMWDQYGVAIATGHRSDIPSPAPDPGQVDFTMAIADSLAFAYTVNDLVSGISEDQRLDAFCAVMEQLGFPVPGTQ